MINLHQLRIFVTVVDYGSFTKAAEHLFLTQPALSAQMRRLRAYVGMPLLARDGRRVVPTEAGATFYRYACEVLAVTDAMRRNLDELGSGELDHIVVGGNRTHGTYVLPHLLARFHRQHPTLHLSLIDAPSDEIVERVRTDQIDVGLIASEPAVPGLVVSQLGEDDLIIVESARHPISRHQTMTVEALAQAPFVRTLLGSAPLGAPLDRLLADHGFGPRRVVLEMTTWEGIKDAVREGVGLALAFRAIVQQDLAAGDMRVVQVEGYQNRHTLYLICSPHRRSARYAPVMQALLEFLQREVPLGLHPPSASTG